METNTIFRALMLGVVIFVPPNFLFLRLWQVFDASIYCYKVCICQSVLISIAWMICVYHPFSAIWPRGLCKGSNAIWAVLDVDIYIYIHVVAIWEGVP